MALGYVTAPIQTSKIHHQQQNTQVFVDQTCLGKGTLFITEDNVLWQCTDGTGFELFYPSIQLHAISRDKNAFDKDCLYLMVEGANAVVPQMRDNSEMESRNDEGSDDENCEDEDESSCCEVRFCPDNVADLEPMFLAMNRCQELNPDPTMNENSSEDENEYEGDNNHIDIEEGEGDRYFFNSNNRQDESAQPENAFQQYFTADGQFNPQVLLQLQSGQQVQLDSNQEDDDAVNGHEMETGDGGN